MGCKILLVICAVICVVGSLEAASLKVVQNRDSVVHKLDYDEVHENVRGSRQTHEDDTSGESSDEDDEEDDAEQLQENIIRQQQAEEQAINDSQEGSDEDDEGDDEEEDDDDDDSFFGRRLRRDVVESETINEIPENSKPSHEEDKETSEGSSTDATAAAAPSAPASPNTSVLILIRDAIKKVTTELPNTQQVATSAQQYFQMFEHFLQQTIEQVIGDDDDETEIESTTNSPVSVASETADKENETASASADKETAGVVPEQKPETIESSQVVETKV